MLENICLQRSSDLTSVGLGLRLDIKFNAPNNAARFAGSPIDIYGRQAVIV